MVATTSSPIVLLPIVKLACVNPAATVAEAGTTAAAASLESVTTVAVVAGAFNVIVASALSPPLSARRSSVTLDTNSEVCTVVVGVVGDSRSEVGVFEQPANIIITTNSIRARIACILAVLCLHSQHPLSINPMQSRASLPSTICLAIVACAVMMSIGCRAELPAQPTTPPVSLRMLYGLASCRQLQVGSSLLFDALTYDDGLYQAVPGQAVLWSSSNPSVLAPSTSGFFSVVGIGTAEARAAYQGKSAAVVVTIPASLTLPYLEVTVGPGQQGRVELRTGFGTPTTNITSAATFASSDTRIAAVDGSRVMLQGPIGNAEIRATANGLSGACALSVYPRSF